MALKGKKKPKKLCFICSSGGHLIEMLPVGKVLKGHDHFWVTFRSPITKETVGKALGQLLAGTKFHRMIQSRGQQGIGSSGCTMLSQTTTGKPTRVITGPHKEPAEIHQAGRAFHDDIRKGEA